MDLGAVIQYLYPNAVVNVDYTMADYGSGPTITYWNTTTLGAQPSATTLSNTWTNTVQLLDAQTQKISSLRVSARNTILAGFTSNATGNTYLYPAQNTNEHPDQLNLVSCTLSSVIAQTNGNTGFYMPFWCQNPTTGAWTYVNHTGPQIMSVGTTGKLYIVSQQTRLNNLITQVNGCTGVAQVNAINW